MLALLTRIQKTIIPQYQHKLNKKEQTGGMFILTETDPSAKCKEARFTRSIPNLLVYKFDQKVKDPDGKIIDEPLAFFQKGKERAKCDYFIFYPFTKGKEIKLFVFVCNLKSNTTGNNKDQLLAGEDLGNYLVTTAIRCFNAENEGTAYKLRKDVKFVKVLFDSSKTKKGLSKIRKNGKTFYNKKQFENYKCGTSDSCDLDVLCLKYWK